MTIEEIVKGIVEQKWSYTQPFRKSMRSHEWVLEIIDDNNDDDVESVIVEWKEGTRAEMYAIYEEIKKRLGHDQ